MEDGKEIKMKVPMKENATPVAQKPLRVPYLLTDPLKQQLEEFVENDITSQSFNMKRLHGVAPLLFSRSPRIQTPSKLVLIWDWSRNLCYVPDKYKQPLQKTS